MTPPLHAHEAPVFIRRRLIAGIATLLTGMGGLTGCGFRLRGTTLPQGLGDLTVSCDWSLLGEGGQQLRSALARKGLATVASERPHTHRLVFTELTQNRGAIASTSSALVREVQLRLRASWTLQAVAGESQSTTPQTMELTRDVPYNETQALAKEYEITTTWNSLFEAMAQQMIFRLAALSKPSPPHAN